MQLRSVRPSQWGKNRLRDENGKSTAGCGSGSGVSWCGCEGKGKGLTAMPLQLPVAPCNTWLSPDFCISGRRYSLRSSEWKHTLNLESFVTFLLQLNGTNFSMNYITSHTRLGMLCHLEWPRWIAQLHRSAGGRLLTERIWFSHLLLGRGCFQLWSGRRPREMLIWQ